ncbi:MAG: PTS glucose transporter subunit IIBC [Candidatus Eremiobacteraeota bacterium]|nr:PTS glucose transporter subunit IIBC [Candidatus Eremiobacteraeota bacterium]
MKGLFAVLQQIGRSLMLPVSVLPVAGILLGVGSAKFSWMNSLLADVMAKAGGSIFDNLPLIFAIGVALGFANFDGVAAVAATVGFFVLISTMGQMAEYRHLPEAMFKNVDGIHTLETGVFGGILIGLLAGNLFKRFYRIELPAYLGFFAGKRFVPIITGVCALIMGIVMSYLWPPIQGQINIFSDFVANRNPALSVAIYGVVERGLIPFGLHHIWNNPFFFTIGDYIKDGVHYHGDITRFMQGDKTAGILGGAYLFKMWGLPAAAIAMWHSAKPERRKEVGGIMISAAFTSFLTGITEPIEFSFLFVAPLLYGIHACLAGSAFFVMYEMGGRLGTTFSHGLIDYVVLYAKCVNPYLVFVLGPIYAVIYYVVFRAAIRAFNLKTPGREDEVMLSSTAGEAGGLAGAVLEALGGPGNLAALDACITRLRVTVKSMPSVKVDVLKQLGATGVMVVGDSLQAIYGTRSENIKTDIEAILAGRGQQVAKPVEAAVAAAPLVNDAKPLTGEQAEKLRRALGGKENVLESGQVAVTRLRVRVRETARVDRALLQELGARDVQDLGGAVLHVLVGPESARWSKTLEDK